MIIASLPDIADHLSVRPKSISVADIGAAFYGQRPIYQPLLDSVLAQLYAFEADQNFASELRSLYPNATVIHDTIADGADHTLHICPAGMTSLLEPDPTALAFFNLFPEWGTVERTLTVKTRKLDDVDELPPVDFLKIDIQGSELMVLKHGKSKLADCVAIQVEMSFMTLYKNQPTFGELDVELRAMGFMPHCFAELKQWSIAPTVRAGDPRLAFHQVLEADMVYIRNMLKASELSDEQIRKLAVISHACYNSPDLTARCMIELRARNLISGSLIEEYLAGIR